MLLHEKLHSACPSHQIIEYEIKGHVARMGGSYTSTKYSVGTKRGRSTSHDNNTEVGRMCSGHGFGRFRLDSSGSKFGPVASSCKHDTEASGSVKGDFSSSQLY
jgi:hypothetical protein